MNSKYTKALFNDVSILDKVVAADGDILTLLSNIIESESDNSIYAMYKIICKIEEMGNVKQKKAARQVELSLATFVGCLELTRIAKGQNLKNHDTAMTLEQLIGELNELIGLDEVKCSVSRLINFQKVQLARKTAHLKSPQGTLHLAFTGNPGTGKTTVARIVGKIYNQLGLLSKGHFMEVSRTDLIAGYQGQTALKVRKVIDKARGGVLFIDEAYSITENEHTDSYGRECLTELTKALEDYRNDLVVIVAGYTKPMEIFFRSNPGLKSRFNTFIEFPDYTNHELIEILQKMCNQNDYQIAESALQKLFPLLNSIRDGKEFLFSNARFIRNIYEKLSLIHAQRVVHISNPTVEDLSLFVEEDIENLNLL